MKGGRQVGKEDKRAFWRQIMDAASLPLNLVVATFVGFAIGYSLDGFFGTSPYLTVIFLILGIIAGFRELFRYARRLEREDDKADK